MSEDFDNTLRKALRPVDPGEDFTARVLARVAAEGGAGGASAVPPVRKGRRFVLPVALAASLILAVVSVHAWKVREKEEGLAARDQVMEALRVTSEKLDLAYQTVNSPAPADDESGA